MTSLVPRTFTISIFLLFNWKKNVSLKTEENMYVVLATLPVYSGMKEMVVLIFVQNRSAGNQVSSDVSAFTYFPLDD